MNVVTFRMNIYVYIHEKCNYGRLAVVVFSTTPESYIRLDVIEGRLGYASFVPVLSIIVGDPDI